RPFFKDGRDAHPTITIKIISYLIRDPNTDSEALPPIFLLKREAEPLDISKRSREVNLGFLIWDCIFLPI
ncbi:hypothetical protein QUA50_26220, partial [Microcoleus sp. M2_D5]|uniref:hypothetical protein n=1 Tax=Microcoleus sp. M2_D5 TaxID=3055376 RepID=UPI002FD718F1